MNKYNKERIESGLGYRDLGLYIHIPFCVKKCDYCDFLSAPATDETIEKYFNALLTEINSYRGRTKSYRVPTIFIGGGTPSCVNSNYILSVMNTLKEVFDVNEKLETTIEINPGKITREKLRTYKMAGINRLSFGLQSTDNSELKRLGRIHSFEQFEENYNLAREMGFHNINIDLMSALPEQTIISWESTLNKVIELKPEHISAYSLIIEEETPFYQRYGEGAPYQKELPEEDTDRLIYYKTKESLQRNGYQRYEISNYASKEYECRHNTSYWIGTDYLGLGLGASSLLCSARFRNTRNLEHYISLCGDFEQDLHLSNRINNRLHISRVNDVATKKDCFNHNEDEIMSDKVGLRRNFERLSTQQKMEEFMYLGLRLCRGVNTDDFYNRFQQTVEKVFGDTIQQLVGNKLLVIKDKQIVLTDFGIDISNVVLSEFLLDS